VLTHQKQYDILITIKDTPDFKQQTKGDKTMTLKESMNHSKALQYAQLIEACACYVAENKIMIKEPYSVVRIMLPLLAGQKQEHFYVMLLDTKSRSIGAPRLITKGLLDSTPTHPREVFRQAITESAAAIVLIHNHPSGDPTPSREDIECTRRLVESARIIGIPIFDHVIIGEGGEHISLRERNLVSFASVLK
jgi:DNA repair protein RadC